MKNNVKSGQKQANKKMEELEKGRRDYIRLLLLDQGKDIEKAICLLEVEEQMDLEEGQKVIHTHVFKAQNILKKLL